MAFLRGLADYFKSQTESMRMVEEAQNTPAYREALNKYDGIIMPGGEEALKRYLIDLTDYFIDSDGKEKAAHVLEDAWKCSELQNAIAQAELNGIDLGFTLTTACNNQANEDRLRESDFDGGGHIDKMISRGRKRKYGKTHRQKTTRRHKRSSRKHRKKNKKTKRNKK